MFHLTKEYIQTNLADSAVIYQRGMALYQNGSFILKEKSSDLGTFLYEVDGSFGDYTVRVTVSEDSVETSCTCPYPRKGCKHTVAVLLDACNLVFHRAGLVEAAVVPTEDKAVPFLTPEEIRAQALEERRRRAKTESFTVVEGEMIKGSHLVETTAGRQYEVTLHDPREGRGHCTCPDYLTNRLGTCKHLLFLTQHFKRKKEFQERLAQERFPFLDIFWDSETQQPRLFSERPLPGTDDLLPSLHTCFGQDGRFVGPDLSSLMGLLSAIDGHKGLRVQDAVLSHLERHLEERQLLELQAGQPVPAFPLKTPLYPYQEGGVRFALFRKAALIGDEMGLGKTLQAIALAVLKKTIFGFSNVLVITMASLKEQWRREIERFSDERGIVVAGPAARRKAIYEGSDGYFKITNCGTIRKCSGQQTPGPH